MIEDQNLLKQIENELEAVRVSLAFLAAPDIRVGIHLKRAGQLFNLWGKRAGWVPTESEPCFILTLRSAKESERFRAAWYQIAAIMSYESEPERFRMSLSQEEMCNLHIQMELAYKTLRQEALGLQPRSTLPFRPQTVLGFVGVIMLFYVLISIYRESYNPSMWFESGFGEIRVESVQQGWGPFLLGRSVAGNPLKIAGRTYKRGYGTHADSIIQITFTRNAKFLSGICGIDDETQGRGSISCSIQIDGREVYRSGQIAGSVRSASFHVPVEGALGAMLLISNLGDGADYDHADWAELRLE